MAVTGTFRVNSPGVAWEDFQAEVIIVNLESGAYFSTRDVGAEIWRRLVGGVSVAGLEPSLLALYEVEASALAEATVGFVTTLQEHGLLVPAAESAPAPSPEAAPTGEKRTFVAPTLEAYSDMQDLLLLDPIHEVDESGWPNPQ